MEKLLFITPHLSTGGMPQFVLKQIETLINKYEIYLIEWENVTGGVFVVQRDKIQNLLGDRFYSLDVDKDDLFTIINDINPKIIHLHEIPETFINEPILGSFYSNEREYFIVVTTHSSSTNPNTFKYIADRYILVSEWSRDVFVNHFGDTVSCEIWEYPIDTIEYDKDLAKDDMGWDKNKTHVLNVGLFTKGKNQGELFELAKLMGDDFLFHFVGNQANNFEEYWGPLMKDVPSNCIIHGERNDVDRFYKAADVFYFTSNYELSPLAVKEALSYKLPTFIKKLETYKDMYDDKVTYITDNQNVNINNLKKYLKYKNSDLVVVLSHANTEFRKHLLEKSIDGIKSTKLLSTNYPVDFHTQEKFDHFLYTKENPLLWKEEYEKFNVSYNYWYMDNNRNKVFTPFEFEHGYAVYDLMRRAFKYAKTLGVDKIHFMNYDYEISQIEIDENNKLLDDFEMVVYEYDETDYDSKSYCTGFLSTRIDSIEDFFSEWEKREDYYNDGDNFNIFEIKFWKSVNNKNLKIKNFKDLSKYKVNQEVLLNFKQSKEDTLFEYLSNKYSCDKTTYHEYHKVYETFLKEFRNDYINLLEIGIDSGKSVNLWKDYFPNSKIWGVDRDIEWSDDRVSVLKVDQSKIEDLEDLVNKIPKCKLIIDDGSHVAEHQLMTFEFLFDKILLEGGIYIIEDIECSYWNPNSTIYSYKTGYLNIVDYFNKYNHELNSRYNLRNNSKGILSISYGPNCILIKKDYNRENRPYNNINNIIKNNW